MEVFLRMVNVHDYAHSLARALKESSEYRAFQSARDRVKGNGAAESMVEDFHKKQLEAQSLMLQGKELPAAQKEALERLYGVIQGHADVRDLIMAEQRISVLLSDVFKIIGDAVDLELVPRGK